VDEVCGACDWRGRMARTEGLKRGYHAKMIQAAGCVRDEWWAKCGAGERGWIPGGVWAAVNCGEFSAVFAVLSLRRGRKSFADDLLFNTGPTQITADSGRIAEGKNHAGGASTEFLGDDNSAALVEPMACVLRGVMRGSRTGDTTVVIGCGPILD